MLLRDGLCAICCSCCMARSETLLKASGHRLESSPVAVHIPHNLTWNQFQKICSGGSVRLTAPRASYNAVFLSYSLAS